MTVSRRTILRTWSWMITTAWAGILLMAYLAPGMAHASNPQPDYMPDLLPGANATVVDEGHLAGIRGRGNNAKAAEKAELVGVVLWDELGSGDRRPPGMSSATGVGNLQGNQLSTLRR